MRESNTFRLRSAFSLLAEVFNIAAQLVRRYDVMVGHYYIENTTILGHWLTPNVRGGGAHNLLERHREPLLPHQQSAGNSSSAMRQTARGREVGRYRDVRSGASAGERKVYAYAYSTEDRGRTSAAAGI